MEEIDWLNLHHKKKLCKVIWTAFFDLCRALKTKLNNTIYRSKPKASLISVTYVSCLWHSPTRWRYPSSASASARPSPICSGKENLRPVHRFSRYPSVRDGICLNASHNTEPEFGWWINFLSMVANRSNFSGRFSTSPWCRLTCSKQFRRSIKFSSSPYFANWNQIFQSIIKSSPCDTKM